MGLASVIPFLVAPAAAAEEGPIYIGTSYGYAGATYEWAGPGLVRDIDLIVSDWGCDGEPVYAYFRVNRTNGQYWTTSTNGGTTPAATAPTTPSTTACKYPMATTSPPSRS